MRPATLKRRISTKCEIKKIYSVRGNYAVTWHINVPIMPAITSSVHVLVLRVHGTHPDRPR